MPDGPQTQTTKEVADQYLQEEFNMTTEDLPGDETNRLAFERDMAVRQTKLTKADLQVIRLALEENRPLEALRQVTEAIERTDDALDTLGDIQGGMEDTDAQ